MIKKTEIPIDGTDYKNILVIRRRKAGRPFGTKLSDETKLKMSLSKKLLYAKRRLENVKI